MEDYVTDNTRVRVHGAEGINYPRYNGFQQNHYIIGRRSPKHVRRLLLCTLLRSMNARAAAILDTGGGGSITALGSKKLGSKKLAGKRLNAGTSTGGPLQLQE